MIALKSRSLWTNNMANGQVLRVFKLFPYCFRVVELPANLSVLPAKLEPVGRIYFCGRANLLLPSESVAAAERTYLGEPSKLGRIFKSFIFGPKIEWNVRGEEHTENIQEETNVIDMPDTDVADAESSEDEKAGSEDMPNSWAGNKSRAGAFIEHFKA
ncbi:hypothetical protein QVD17_30641 [Tagetes erecta]|uniref:Uncharacterized protein n=1 Tax=Tagetes erecta TaxID=13708 RepID=A0AAD8K8A7_TARER|nr:hypothetical protein QVD17_30641 [Tagetes erecta]